MKYIKVILMLVIIILVSCSSYRYFDVKYPYAQYSISGGYLTYGIYSIEPEINFAQYSDEKFAVKKNSIFYKKFSKQIDYLRSVQLDTNMSYLAFTLYYRLIDEKILMKVYNDQDVSIVLDSIFIMLNRSYDKYQLNEFYSEQHTYKYHEQPYKYGIDVSPIGIPKDYKQGFEIYLNLKILFEDSLILNDTNLVVPVEYKKKTRSFLNPWP